MEYRAIAHEASPEEYRALPRFNMDRRPIAQRHILRPLSWILSYPDCRRHKLKIEKRGMEGMKPPFILICNHSSFLDFKVTTMALFPWRSSYVVAIDGFIGREWILRQVGGILKRRVTTDVRLVRHLRTALREQKLIVSIYPEARYTLIGTPSILPESLGKLVKMSKVPVCVLKMHGNYLTSPVWNLADRGCPIEAELFKLYGAEEVRELSVEAINEGIRDALSYDEYAWQRERGILIDYPDRAKGLHHVIYHCPACGAQHRMDSARDQIWCGSCGKRWAMGVDGAMRALSGATEFPHLPDWFAFQRAAVREEVRSGKYRFEDEVRVESLVNKRGYWNLGTARLTHTLEGFRMEGDPAYLPEPVVRKPLSMYSCHVEYDYFGKGDCFDLSTLHDTFYVYPLTKRNVVTKILLATEEIYIKADEESKKAAKQAAPEKIRSSSSAPGR
jgi:hypothetical protein